MISKRIYYLVSYLKAVVCVLTIIPATSIAATQSELKEFVIKNVRHNESLFRNFETRFSIKFLGPDGTPEPVDDPKQIVKQEHYYVREGDKLFDKYQIYNTAGVSQDVTMAFDGEFSKFYRADLKQGLIQARKRFPTIAGPDRFTNLYRNVRDLTMSEFLEQSVIKRIEPCNVEGHEGFMVEVVHCDSSAETPLEQKLYFDADRGFVPVKVETFRLDLSTKEPVMVATVLEFKKFDKNIYFPVRGRLDSFERDESGKMKKSFSVLSIAEDTKVNTELPPDIFNVEFPHGTKVYDEFIDADYVVTEPLGTSGDKLSPIFHNWLFWLVAMITTVIMITIIFKLQWHRDKAR